MRKNKLKKTFIIILLLAISILLFKLLLSKKEYTISLKTEEVKIGNITNFITATGTVEPITQVEVGTQVSGVIEKIYVDYNSKVHKGQLLAELDKTNLKAILEQSQASYNNAINEQDYLKKIYNRKKTLYEKNMISESEYDEALYNLNKSKNTVKQNLLDLEKAKTNLSYANIYSPINGVILSKDVDEGQTVAASYNTPTLFTIAQDLTEMQVEANVDEADIGNIKEGQRTTFTVDAYPKDLFEGIVTQVRLNPTITSNVVTYTVVIKTKNPKLKLKPGLTAIISIYTLELKNIKIISSKALNFKPNPLLIKKFNNNTETLPSPQNLENTLWELKNNTIFPVKVTLGASNSIHTQILQGLPKGAKIVYKLETKSEETNHKKQDARSPFMPGPKKRK